MKMWQLILGTAGFVLYFVYDINSVLSKNVCLQKFFAWGSILVVASVVAEFCSAWGQKKYLCIHHSRMPSAFLLRNAHHAMHDIFFCASLQVYTALNRQPKL